jgi:hypothetical protein
MNKDEVIKTLLAALIDTNALLEHYAEGRKLNWDGSTKQQALLQIRTNNTFIAFIKGELQ